ncbi:hypothetical protein GGI20_003577 [Coemansia sp. BCRC 34301]|nr:hypothetical protein GGI20_003577 [Coemansia sp. BCRC 34301]
MWCTASKALVAALLCVTSVNALPVPQYGPQGMGGGGFGYPMNGPMMGNGGGGGPYGMGCGDSYGPMNMGNNYNGGGRYNNMRMMRGQRYNAHASPDMWPIPKNPYRAARWNRGNANGFYDNGNGGGFDGFRGPAHNRVSMDDNGDSDDDGDEDNDKSKGNTRVAGVNRAPADTTASSLSSSANENAGMTDLNTSINLAAMSDKIINIGAFDGATMKATSTAATSTASPSAAKKTEKASTSNARQTVTRSLGSVKPTQAARNAVKPTPRTQAAVHAKAANTASSKPVVSSIARAAAVLETPVALASPTTAHAQQTSHSKAGVATSTKREPSMKKIRGL